MRRRLAGLALLGLAFALPEAAMAKTAQKAEPPNVLVVTSGTDTPVEEIDPLANFQAAVTRRMADGRAFHPGQRMTREEALRSMTVSAAFAAFEEDSKGTLSPGKYADLTVLSQDLRTIPEDRIRETRVRGTIVGGRVFGLVGSQ